MQGITVEDGRPVSDETGPTFITGSSKRVPGFTQINSGPHRSCTGTFTVALFLIIKTRQQPQVPPAGGRPINRVRPPWRHNWPSGVRGRSHRDQAVGRSGGECSQSRRSPGQHKAKLHVSSTHVSLSASATSCVSRMREHPQPLPRKRGDFVQWPSAEREEEELRARDVVVGVTSAIPAH